MIKIHFKTITKSKGNKYKKTIEWKLDQSAIGDLKGIFLGSLAYRGGVRQNWILFFPPHHYSWISYILLLFTSVKLRITRSVF